MVVEHPDTKVGHMDHNLSTRKHGEMPSEMDHDEEMGDTALEANGHPGRLKSNNPFMKLIFKLTRRNELELEKKKEVVTLEMLQPSRYKPNDLEQMAEETKFTKKEVRALYRSFKQECPNGIVDEETFKEVYERIFPLGDASRYAHLVFAAIDRENTGGITFGDFMEFLSVISKGTTHDKMLWAFTFYDLDRDGVISKDEMIKVTDAIHELMGEGNRPNNYEAKKHVEKVFDNMDTNQDGRVTMEEFLIYCNSNQACRESLAVLP